MADFNTINFGWGKRHDGSGTYKGPGFMSGRTPDGSVVTEWSGDMPTRNGIMAYPTVYHDITPWDFTTIMNAVSPTDFGMTLRRPPNPPEDYRPQYRSTDPLLPEVSDRAYEAALVRLMMGLSPYIMDGEPTQSDALYHYRRRGQ